MKMGLYEAVQPANMALWYRFSLKLRQPLLISSENFAQKLIMKGGASFSTLSRFDGHER